MDPTEPLLKNLKTFVAFARKRVGDPHLAEDVVQESLLKALKADRKPVRNDDVVAWFYRILRRGIIDVYRRSNTRQRALESLRAELPEHADAAAERVICQCIKRLLPSLPEQYSDLLRRIDLEGESIPDAASDLGITANNLTVRLHRARQRVRMELERTCRLCSKHGCLDCSCEG